MNILHITPHLGGGVGKAHAALRSALPDEIDQTFVLLEAPRDKRYADALVSAGARVVVADSLDYVMRLAHKADIVQFEFWNHPRLFECLARCPFPAMRSVFWSHVSGLHKPFIPPGLIDEAMRFVFTTEASRASPSLALVSHEARSGIGVVNSGFGFDAAGVPPRARGTKPAIAYLGTVDFVKMHPGFFDAIDKLAGDNIRVSVWGAADPAGEVIARARAMRRPERIVFRGQTTEPARALSEADIFFYPLRHDHYGTAENALIEAMSLGLVPVVLGNAAERAIVRDGETGFIARSIDEAASLLEMLLVSPGLRATLSRKASDDIAEKRTPKHAAHDFMVLWLGLIAKAPRISDFARAIGTSPADWYAATQHLPGTPWVPADDRIRLRAKGSLAHFESVFAGDASLARLRQ
ncbi:MAG TPA: glycosyltransferase [Pseudolabrys sp.]|nr:glycosyltransferase [Pseudolabrys sp.]